MSADNKHSQISEGDDDGNDETQVKRYKNSAYCGQKRKIEKLMQQIDKPIELPDTSMTLNKKKYEAPDFVRNIMGSSAGAGSGEFHVYRHLRRKEMTRLKEMDVAAKEEEEELEFRRRLEENKRIADERTAKKRLKREKKKKKKI